MKKLWYHHDISALSGSTSISSIWVIFAISKWSIHLSSFGKTSVHLVGISLTPRLCCSAAEPFSAKYRIGSLLRVLPLYLWKSEGSKGWIGMLARLGIKCHLLRIWALSGLSWALSLVFSALSLLGLVLVCRVFYIRSKFWTDYTWVPSAFLRRSRFCFLGALGRPSNNSRCIKTSKQKTAARWFLSQKFFVLTVPRLCGGLFAKQPRFNKTNLQEDGPIFRNSLKRKAALPGEKKAYVASLRIFKHVMW